MILRRNESTNHDLLEAIRAKYVIDHPKNSVAANKVEHDRDWYLSVAHYFAATVGFTELCCFNCNKVDRIRDTSFVPLLLFGLKSHNLDTRSHSDPGLCSSLSATNSFSAALQNECMTYTTKTLRQRNLYD